MTVRLYHYVLPPKKLEGWAEIVLSSGGFFGAVSDWGNYAYAWRHWGGGDFRAFVLNLARDPDYVVRKIAPTKYYDGATTRRIVLEALREYVDRGLFTPVDHEKEYRLFHDHGGLDNEYEFTRWCSATRLENPGELRGTTYDRDALAFSRHLLPRLAALVQAELAAEAAQGSATKEEGPPA